jgi:isoleucyl-tRNA synthetase
MFTPFDPKKTMPQVEEEVLTYWEENKIFEKSVEQRKDNESFVFFEGPPTANGRPGIHHVMARTFKDAITRYQTMKGKYVLRKAGWDTHGLPVELQVEKALGLKNKQDIETYGIDKFNDACRQSVWEYKEEWEKLTKRIGYWEDMDHPYITYDKNYIESVWWGLKQVWDKGLIYQDYKVVPFCARCGTGLSLAEVAQGYKDVTEMSVYIKFALTDEENAFVLAWTTTPWTLPGNVALAVGSAITYVQVKQGEETYYLAKDRLKVLNGEYVVVRELLGSELVDRHYRPLFDFVDLSKESGKDAYKIVPADFVTTEDGSGVVHTAVMYGEDDFNLGKQFDLPAVHTVNPQGQFTELVTSAKPEWGGRFVKEVDADLMMFLKEQGSLYKKEQTTHTYPFCWRCSTPLLYYARTSWFVRIDQALRDKLVANNQEITWVPEHVKNGRFGKWLEGLRDWAISRERYWGTPLPIWVCDTDTNHKHMVGSYAELAERSGAVLSEDFDPHKPGIDAITLSCTECDGTMHRVPEVLDVWFDSGMMPYAQWHYPFENKEMFAKQFPADFISEGVDQTRGWFNSLHILAEILMDGVAYKSVTTPNLVLDEKGQKMSKSKGNTVNPWEAMGKTGIDAIRFFFTSVNRPGDNKNYSDKAIQDVYRKTIAIWWNVTSFFLTYASVDQWQPGQTGELTILDKWILSRLQQTVAKVDTALTDLDTFTASRTMTDFLDELSTWYLRRNRKRRDAAFYATLHEVLLTTAKLMAPLTPFTAEAVYRALRTNEMPQSVHLTDFPVAAQADEALLETMATVRQFVTLGHAARVQAKLKVRQPLARAILVGKTQLTHEMAEIVADELNVKQVSIEDTAPSDWPTAENNSLTIALDPNLTDALLREGMARELVRELQALRKQAGCQPGQFVSFVFETPDAFISEVLANDQVKILEETTGTSITAGKVEAVDFAVEVTLNNQPLWLGLTHVNSTNAHAQ